MTPIVRKWGVAAVGLVAASGAWFGGTARGQAVAYTPQVSAILNGSAMQVTPVVSADRRYVRVTVNATFNTVNGFTTYTAPLGAVSGGGAGSIGGGGTGAAGGGGAGGLGGIVGGGGVVGGGAGVVGGFAGMSGPIYDYGMSGPMGGYGMSGPMGAYGMSGPMGGFGMTGPMPVYGQDVSYRAGAYPPAAAGPGMGFDDAMDPNGQAGVPPRRAGQPDGAPVDPAQADAATPGDAFHFADVPAQPSIRPSKRTAAARRQAARKAARRPTTKARSSE